jgi:DNA polymerase III delta subunit
MRIDNERDFLVLTLFLILTCPDVNKRKAELMELAQTAESLLGKYSRAEQNEIDKIVHQKIVDERLQINEDVFDFLLPESRGTIH